MKFNLLVVDPPWSFSDPLTMSDVKRGANSQYNVLHTESICGLPIQKIIADDAVLALWVVGSQLQEGLDVMKAWGFRQTQTWVWVKTKQNPLEALYKDVLSWLKSVDYKFDKDGFLNMFSLFSLDNILSFNMGRLFRQTHEICLIGVKGKVYDKLQNKSQRSVCFDVPKKHSAKTELLQNRLDIMFPSAIKLEVFGRRERPGWTVVGNECPSTLGEDIFDSIDRLEKLP